MTGVVEKIEGVEACIQRCEKRLDDIERSLRLAELSDQERGDLESEEKILQKELDCHKKDLRSLRKENFKSMFISVCILLVGYGIYQMFWS
ncbi:hypothetical protein LSH36_463g02000 [Paralvinella palmiformis]|uniref:Coiled-coil domain-containing protein 167 n=1 Tax=Paralvinella palmiformis TaxID=53620 RepID=A0AAD9JAC5_9ANNE|nr:hypothetical protein LSH36_463g02000 [Paralvinella palmiformis]